MSLPGTFRIGTARDYGGCGCEGAAGCERPVYGRLCTEADSWGVEWLHLCKIHYLAAQCYDRLGPEPLGDCDWCHAIDVVVAPMRDYEEGMYGPVYDVCDCCRKAKNKQAQEDYDATFDDEDEEEYIPQEHFLVPGSTKGTYVKKP